MMQYINYFDGYIENNEIWFSNSLFNALMKINIDTGETVQIDTFIDEEKITEELHLRVFEFERKLYFIPYEGNKIHIYEMDKFTWDKPIILQGENIRYVCAEKVNDEVWIFSESLINSIWILNLTNGRVEKEVELASEIVRKSNGEPLEVVGSSVCVKKDTVILALHGGNRLYYINPKKRIVEREKQLPEGITINGISQKSENQLWISSRYTADIYILDEQTSEIGVVNTGIEFTKGRIPFSRIVSIDDNAALILPWHIDEFYYLNTVENRMEQIEIPGDFHRCKALSLTCFIRKIRNKIYIFSRSGNNLLVFDVEKLQMNCISASISEANQKRYDEILHNEFVNKVENSVMMEARGWKEQLPMFLDYVVGNQGESNERQAKRNIGQDIHQIISKKINYKVRD